MKITDLTEKDAVHCATQEEFNRVILLIPNNSLEKNIFGYFGDDDTCISDFDQRGEFERLSWYKSNGYNIIPSEQITDTVESDHKCQPIVNADWTHLTCDCGKRYLPGESQPSPDKSALLDEAVELLNLCKKILPKYMQLNIDDFLTKYNAK